MSLEYGGFMKKKERVCSKQRIRIFVCPNVVFL